MFLILCKNIEFNLLRKYITRMSSNSSSEYHPNEGNFMEMDYESSSHPKNISVSRRNSQQSSSSSSGNLLQTRNVSNTQADFPGGQYIYHDNQGSPVYKPPQDNTLKHPNQQTIFFGPCRPPTYQSQAQVKLQCCNHEQQASQHLSSSPVMSLECSSCPSGSHSYSPPSSSAHQGGLLGASSYEEQEQQKDSVKECSACAKNVDLRGYSLALIAPSGAIIPGSSICAGALMKAGNCNSTSPVLPSSVSSATAEGHYLQYSNERLHTMAHSVSSQFIANSSNSSASDLYMSKSPYRQHSSTQRPPSSTPPDNYEFPTLPCQIVS